MSKYKYKVGDAFMFSYRHNNTIIGVITNVEDFCILDGERVATFHFKQIGGSKVSTCSYFKIGSNVYHFSKRLGDGSMARAIYE